MDIRIFEEENVVALHLSIGKQKLFGYMRICKYNIKRNWSFQLHK